MTLGDVAAKAGVSVATASVAITGKPSGNCRVSASVAERIRRAARQLNYRPNIYARNLSTQRTQTVAMLVKQSAGHNAMEFLGTAQRILREQGYIEVFLMQLDDTLENERAHIEICLDRRVEGILMLPVISVDGASNAETINRVMREDGIPVVNLSVGLPDCLAPSVCSDEIDGMCQVVKRLYAMGHRRVAHMTLPGYANASPLNPYIHAHWRYLGYARACAELGLAENVMTRANHPSAQVVAEFDDAVPFGRALGEGPRPLPSAIVCYSDYESAGLLAGLSEAGVRVPDEVSLIGHDDKPFTRMVRPALSTLAPDYQQMGVIATRTLLKMINGEPGESALIPPSILMRESVRDVSSPQ